MPNAAAGDAVKRLIGYLHMPRRPLARTILTAASIGACLVAARTCVAVGCGPGRITTVAGDGWTDRRGQGRYAGDGGPATKGSLWWPGAVAFDAKGDLYVADALNNRIRKIDSEGVITTVAGDGQGRYAGDGGPAAAASLHWPWGLAIGPDGSLYIADSYNNRIRRVDPAGVITTVAANGERGDGGDGGPALEASLNRPHSVALGADGSLYIADTSNHRIRRVDPESVITTVAGDGWRGGRRGEGRSTGDGGPAVRASLNGPNCVMLGPDGSVYVGEVHGNRVRKIDLGGIITTVAGNGTEGYAGDGGPATAAILNSPSGLAIGPDGCLYITDAGNHRIRRVDAEGVITTVVGEGYRGYRGDDGPPAEANLQYPIGIAFGADGALYVADSGNHRIRVVRWYPCDPQVAKERADRLRAEAGDSRATWRDIVELYVIAKSWPEALAAADQVAALSPETDQSQRLDAEVIAAGVYLAKGDQHEARSRLMRVLARADNGAVVRSAASMLVDLYLLQGEREQAIATLQDLRLRAKRDGRLTRWAEGRLAEIIDEEAPR